MSATRDDDRPELEPPVLQGLAQAVPQYEPPIALRARVLESAGSKIPARVATPRPAAWPLAAAASIALAAGLGIYSWQLRGRVTGLESEVRETRARADAAERLVAEAQRAAAGVQRELAVLSAPDVVRVDLAGQAVAPQAMARAFWSRQRGLVFSASNLPPLEAGRTYQLWVVTNQGPLSAGLLMLDATGNTTLTVSTPADIPQPTAMAVTSEPAAEVPAPAPSNDRFYLLGKVT